MIVEAEEDTKGDELPLLVPVLMLLLLCLEGELLLKESEEKDSSDESGAVEAAEASQSLKFTSSRES